VQVNKLNITLPAFIRKGLLAKKWVRLPLEVFGSILALVFVILLLLLGRLSMGPINLDFLTPEIEAVFIAPKVGLSAKIEHTRLVWREWKRPFEIELVNVNLKKDQNPNWLKIEHIGVSLKLYRLLMGDISLKQLRLYRPHILLEKDEQGEFSLEFGEKTPDQEFSFKELAPLLALGESNASLGKLNELKRISIIEADIILKDDAEGLQWDLPKCTFVLRRKTNGFRADLTFFAGDRKGSLTLGIDHKLNSSRFDIYADFNYIPLKSLIENDRPILGKSTPDSIGIDDILNFMQHLDIPLNGTARVALYPETFQIIEGICDVDIGRGELDLSVAQFHPLPINSGNISFSLSPQGIDLKNASILSEEMLLHLSGKLYSESSPLLLTKLLDTGQQLEINGKIEDLFLDHLAAIWPQDIAKHAREWLTQNLRKGTIQKTEFSLKGHGSETGLVIDDLNGTIEGNNAEITYLTGLPPAHNVKATATFDKKGFDIKVLSGEVLGIKLDEGHVSINDLDSNNESITIDIKAKGPLPDVLEVINHKPLEYASYGGIDPKKTKGGGSVNMHIDFPLLRDLQFKDVKIALDGTFNKVEVERKITDTLTAEVKKGEFNIALTHEIMIIKGKGDLNNLPSILTYTHDFKNSKPYQLQIEIQTHATFDDFSRFGFDYREFAKGPTNAKMTFTLEHDEKSRLIVDLDTTPANLSFPPLEWVKKNGEKGHLSFALVFKDGQLSKMKDILMTSPSYSLKGDILFGTQKSWSAIHLSELKGPHTDTQVTLHNLPGNNYEATFKGHRMDVEKFLDYINAGPNDTNHAPTKIKLQADVGELRMGAGKVFKSVHSTAELFLQGKDHTWKEVHFRAKAGEGTVYKGDMANVSGGIVFDIKPGANNTQTLEVRANDAGQFLKNLSIYEEIKGGYITIKALRQNNGPFVGVFKLKKFDVAKIPLLARFAALLSPMGIANLFSQNETISMDRFECDFELSDAQVIVKNGIGKSMSLGFTVEGKLDRLRRIFSLKGNIVPARFINSILNNIPLIGPLISGGEGEGIFGIAYTVKDSFDNPQISLNPLSALAPGFIRRIFQSIGNDEE